MYHTKCFKLDNKWERCIFAGVLWDDSEDKKISSVTTKQHKYKYYYNAQMLEPQQTVKDLLKPDRKHLY